MLCSTCSDADFNGAWNGRMQVENFDRFVVDKNTHDLRIWTWKRVIRAECDLCVFLNGLLNANQEEPDSSPNESLYKIRRIPKDSPDKFDLQMVEVGNQTNALSGWAIRARPSTGGFETTSGASQVKVAPPIIGDYNRFQSYIVRCKASHTQTKACYYKDGLDLKAPIKVIDCNLRSVITAPSKCQYLTLSYIWSIPSETSTTSLYPRTVEDAILVTLRLGFQFLWVDRYCIAQSDASELQTQICQMDRIYRNAQACLVAATGRDPNYGLPGVTRPRNSPPRTRVLVDGLDLVMRYDSFSLRQKPRSSPWAQRGWTFQELLFSRRRIYFTGLEVLIDCAYGTCREVGSNVRGSFCKSEFAYLAWPPENAASDLYIWINNYNLRSLTYQDDVPTGVFRRFQRLRAYEAKSSPCMGYPTLSCLARCLFIWTGLDQFLRRPHFISQTSRVSNLVLDRLGYADTIPGFPANSTSKAESFPKISWLSFRTASQERYHGSFH